MKTNDKLRETLVSVKKSIDEMGAASLDGDPEILLMSLTQVCARLSARIDAALTESATTEESSAVGDCAKLPKTVDLRFDICRDIEQVLKIGRDYQNIDGYRGAHYDTVKLLCDAIEYQREQLNAKTEVGDAAKLRKALENLYDQICHGETEQHVAANRQMIRTALAAPVRNCDRFANAEEAWDAYDEWADSYRAQGKTEPFNEFGWLFAPATGKEGLADENEQQTARGAGDIIDQQNRSGKLIP